MLNYTLANANVKGFKNVCQEERGHIDQVIFERIAEAQGMRTCTDIMYTITDDPHRKKAELVAFLGHISLEAADIQLGLDKRAFEQRMR